MMKMKRCDLYFLMSSVKMAVSMSVHHGIFYAFSFIQKL